MSASYVLSWRSGVSTGPAAGGLRIDGPASRFELKPLDDAVAAALLAMAPPGEEEDQLGDAVLRDGGPGALADWYFALQRLARRGLVARSVRSDGAPVATLLPTSPAFPFIPPKAASAGPYVLSRFAYIRREGGALVLESPRAHARVVLEDCRTAALLGALATPGTARELAERTGGLPAEAVALVLGLLAGAGMVEEMSESPGDEPSSLESWEFHDLLFHARSRKGRSDAPFGATFRGAGRFELPPAVKPPGSGDSFALFRPDMERLEREDPPLARVVESRRSGREYAARPIDARQLGEFLYRVARVRDIRYYEVDTPAGPSRLEVVSRPYPSGGALHELEFYAAIAACDGIDAGLYHYEALDHRLRRLSSRTPDVGRLLADAAASAGVPPDGLQVLIVLATRLPRLSWKYSSIAYALTLKHIGVVYQTMYLSAGAMGLSACALGGGDAELFARASGADYYAETSVGEFLLGSRPREAAP